jgi:hypothetical protein
MYTVLRRHTARGTITSPGATTPEDWKTKKGGFYMMHTNTIYTHNILNGYTDAAGRIDVNYFAHCVEIVADNNRPTSEEKYNTRRKPRNVAITWLMYFIDTELYFNYGRGYYATNAQVMKWDKTHAGQLEEVLDIVTNYIIAERNEQ